MMPVLKTINEIQAERTRLEEGQLKVGLVPTMGALHQGHLEIIRQANEENDAVIVSIFVNPTQFNNASDLEKYPRNLDGDLLLLREISEDLLVFTPTVVEMYPENTVAENYDFNGLDLRMEGEFRPGHFQGVATIVERLLRITNPDRAYFGEKDYQQLQIIRSLVAQKDLNVEIIGCSIVREPSGLALSSRNARLSKRLRNEASFIYKTLNAAKKQFGTESAQSIVDWAEGEFKNHSDLKMEYFTIADDRNLVPIEEKETGIKYRAFIAVYAGDIRLIDNLALN